MPIAGKRKSRNIGRDYENDPMRKQVEEFIDLSKNLLSENNVNLFMHPSDALMEAASNDALREHFVNESVDPESFGDDVDAYDDHINMMNEQYENDREALLEYSALGMYNPVIGMSFPVHKNILMNSIYDKGGIPKVVAVSPKFTIELESRYIVTPAGERIDIFKEQNRITEAMNSSVPFKEIELALPEIGHTDLLTLMGAASYDNLSIQTYISQVKVPLKYKAGDVLPDKTVAASDTTADTWINVRLPFTPGYGAHDRQLMQDVELPANIDSTETVDTLSGFMKDSKVTINTVKGIIKGVKLSAKKDASNGMLDACSVEWNVRTDIVEIPEAIPLNTPVSPEEVKDVGALYQVNQLTKVMSMLKLCLENYKDDTIRDRLDDSFQRLPASQKMFANFDFAPREGYALDHVEWRHKTFFDALDTHVTDMLQVLNDPNMTINIFGRPDIIRKITPTDYTYQSPNSIGPVELDFNKTVTTSDKRTYQFMSSNKLRNSDDLTIILCPRNTQRIIYRIYDYQMYVSNEIRNVQKYTLPAVHAFERWQFVEYQPVQGRVHILNPSGIPHN